jgi:hypothetical protein
LAIAAPPAAPTGQQLAFAVKFLDDGVAVVADIDAAIIGDGHINGAHELAFARAALPPIEEEIAFAVELENTGVAVTDDVEMLAETVQGQTTPAHRA